MIPLVQLWLPIVAAAVAVFVASSLIHMVFKWHNADYRKLPNEDEVAGLLRQGNAAPGKYVLPHCPGMKQMAEPGMRQKFTDGPVAMIMLRKPGLPRMGPMLGLWFALNLLVAGLAVHVAAGGLGAGAGMRAGCAVGVITFLAYGAGSLSNGIWMGNPGRSVAKEVLDAAIFGAVSMLAAGWLWP